MYSHMCGYKFYIEVYLDGCTERHVGAMYVYKICYLNWTV